MRKMTAEKDKSKSSSQEKPDTSDSATTSPPANSGPGTSNRLTGRTASQVQGATRASNQLGMNDTVSFFTFMTLSKKSLILLY